MKKEIGGLLALTGICFGTLAGGAGNVRALTYSDESNVQFSFSSTLSISISDADIVIGNLIPGQDDTSNTVDVIVNTNNLYGYTLTATVGDATKDYRDLRHTNGTTNIASIDVNSDLSTLSGQSSSVWGYTVSTNGTTWSNYNGLPKYDDTQNTAELRATDGAAADSTTSFKIGAYAEEGQLAGDYTNVINFKVVSNIAKIYMQNITSATCPTEPTIVYDNRDEEEYTIAQLADGKCWLLDNLRLGGDAAITLTPNDTNIASNFVLPAGSTLDTPESYTTPFIFTERKYSNTREPYDIGYNGLAGNFYNYCAVSGGTNCSDENAGIVKIQYDICPKGWRLPTGGDDVGELYALLDSYDATYSTDNYTFIDAFRLALAGQVDASSRLGAVAYYWSSTAYDSGAVYGLEATFDYYPGDLVYLNPSFTSLRSELSSVRCILK